MKALILVVSAILALTGCSNPETPQEVTQAFWTAVLENDAGTATELSTLVDEGGYDAFGLSWSGAEVQWGRVSASGSDAEIETIFSNLAAADGETLKTTTHLVRINDQWQVDYHQTSDAITSDLRVGSLIGSVKDLGERFRSRFEEETGKASRELERLMDELTAYSEQTREEMSALFDRYGDHLEQRLDELSRSLDEALEQNPSASEEDRQIIEQALAELEKQQQALADNAEDAVPQVSRELARIQQRLSELSDRSFEQLKEQLQRWTMELNRELEQLNQEARMKEQHSI